MLHVACPPGCHRRAPTGYARSALFGGRLLPLADAWQWLSAVLLLAMRGPRPVWGGRLLLLVDAWHWPSATMHVLLYTPGEPGRYALFEVSGDGVESGRALGDGVEATAETSC